MVYRLLSNGQNILGIDGNVFLSITKRYKGDTRTTAKVIEKIVKEAIYEFTIIGKKKLP